MANYSKRVWLNKEGSASTGSIVAFHGMTTYGKRDPEMSTFLEIADCHGKVSLHLIAFDDMEDFIKKMRLLSKTAKDFADYLSKK